MNDRWTFNLVLDALIFWYNSKKLLFQSEEILKLNI